MRPYLFALLTLLSVAPALAQKPTREEKAYNQESEEIRQSIWEMSLPQFAVREIPEAYRNKSTVVIARYIELTAGKSRRMRNKVMQLEHTTRELIRLNDAAAVKEYSELEFTKSIGGAYSINNLTTFIGGRVIKPDGKIREINLDDIVQTKDDKTQKEAKLAVADLQPGDLIDIYTVKQISLLQVDLSSFPFYFSFYDDVPVLHQSLHCEISKDYAVEYRCYNGAPDFAVRKNEDRDNVLDITTPNLPYYPDSYPFLVPWRQLPLIHLNVVMGYSGWLGRKAANARRTGEVYRNQDAGEILEDEITHGVTQLQNFIFSDVVSKSTKPYYDLVKDQGDNLDRDSLAAALYYIWRFDELFERTGTGSVGAFINYDERDYNNSMYAFRLAQFMKKHDLDADLVLSTSMYAPPLDLVMERKDIQYMLGLPGTKNPSWGFDGLYTMPFTTPYFMQGQKGAVGVTIRAPLKAFHTVESSGDRRTLDIPASTAADNVHIEKITASLDESGANALKLQRTVTLSGAYKSSPQKKLLLLQDFYRFEAPYFLEERSLTERLEDDKRTRKLAGEIGAALEKERRDLKDRFTEEAKGWFEEEDDITDISDYKVIAPGVRHTAPDFIYSADLKMQNAVKRAGDNYIITVGRLAGASLKVTDDQRKRPLDIRSQFARTVRTEIRVLIPEGYTAEGVDALARNVKNDKASFVVTATSDGSAITIVTEKKYNAANEPASAWPDLLAVIDASYDWGSSKILLKKKG